MMAALFSNNGKIEKLNMVYEYLSFGINFVTISIISRCSDCPPGTNAINFAKSMTRQNIAQLKKNNLRAYLVHFGATLGPKVFLTRSKQK